jgi:hypothetical protein
MDTNNIRHIEQLFQRSQLEYRAPYTALYASFNAWYRCHTHTKNDRQALNTLRQGHRLWREYMNGQALIRITPYMIQLAELTQREPLSYTTPHWKGEIQHRYDWPSLVEYWYRVRCLVVHGDSIQPTYVYLAYHTLNIFMTELITRIKS